MAPTRGSTCHWQRRKFARNFHCSAWDVLGPPLIGDTMIARACLGRGNGAPNPACKSQVRCNLCPPDWAKFPLPNYENESFREHTMTSQRSTEEVEAFRKANDVVITGRDLPNPILTIDEANFPKFLRRNIEARNHGSSVSALQAQCWPVALRGRDLVAFTNSASEENSLAYLAPGIVHVQRQPAVPPGCGPIVLILTATQEAAQQVRVVSDVLIEGSGMRTMFIVSGDAKRPQLKQLEEGAEICIATPGRLLAFMEDCKVNLHRCTYLVLDEADRMLAMGFAEHLRTVAANVRPDRQTLVWLADRTRDTQELVEELTNDCVTVSVGATAHKCQNWLVKHIIDICDESEKKAKLVALLKDVVQDQKDRMIVFVERKQTVEDLMWSVRLQGLPAVGIHGGHTEQEREWALNALRFGKVLVLVATDVAGRAIDAENMRFVVNYDCPSSPDEYRRRFKHALRTDGTGAVYTFLGRDDSRHAEDLARFLTEAKLDVPPLLHETAKKVARR
ncbi:hypothetical protein MTO96_037230 [Rhipicephalus appendiculatus]